MCKMWKWEPRQKIPKQKPRDRQRTDNGQTDKATNVEYIAKCKTQRKQTKWNNQTKVALAKHHKTNRYETKLKQKQNIKTKVKQKFVKPKTKHTLNKQSKQKNKANT